ncbi:MAG: glycine oxidase ThiO [Bacteroidota bacterium]|nr:glycine oxidase ThiO [Bacteroidota bacterium]
MKDHPHIIIGGGIIGLSIGWQLLRAGRPVEIYEESAIPRSGAGWNAAGMLAPHAEAGYEEEALYNLCLQGLSAYPEFLSELREDVRENEVPALDRCGSMIVAVTADDSVILQRKFEFRKKLGQDGMELIRGAEAREREPLLSPKVKQALYLANDGQINNRKLISALHEAFLNRGGIIHEHQQVDRVVVRKGKAEGVEVSGVSRNASSITVAAGALAGKIKGIDPIGIRPVKGQVVTLKSEPSAELHHLIRSPRIYLAAKDDGRLLVGASAEEKGLDRRITAGPIMELLHYAWEVLPAVYELEITELQSGMRPASRDNCPIIGQADEEGLYYATGHYRNGILLAPLTAYALRDEILLGTKRADLQVFSPSRFSQEAHIIEEVV